MAVARQSSVASNMPIHIAEPADGAPYADCSSNVSHKNAPGAISAMALLVSPVRPNVGFIVPWAVPNWMEFRRFRLPQTLLLCFLAATMACLMGFWRGNAECSFRRHGQRVLPSELLPLLTGPDCNKADDLWTYCSRAITNHVPVVFLGPITSVYAV